MPTKHDIFRRAFLIYYIHPHSSHKNVYMFVNRLYKPVGLNLEYSQYINYEDYPVWFKVKGFTDRVKKKVSFNNQIRECGGVFLYNDGCIPGRGIEYNKSYFMRLGYLLNLHIEPFHHSEKTIPK